MSSMAYKMTAFSIFFNYAMIIVNLSLAPLFFPDGTPQIQTASGITDLIMSMEGMIQALVLTAGVLALFAFSLLIPTIPFIMTFFRLNAVVSSIYIVQFINIPPYDPITGTSIWAVPLIAGIFIIYYLGIAEYSSRQKI